MSTKETEKKKDLTQKQVPDGEAYRLYAMLTEENKEKVNRFVANLKAAKCSPRS